MYVIWNLNKNTLSEGSYLVCPSCFKMLILVLKGEAFDWGLVWRAKNATGRKLNGHYGTEQRKHWKRANRGGEISKRNLMTYLLTYMSKRIFFLDRGKRSAVGKARGGQGGLLKCALRSFVPVAKINVLQNSTVKWNWPQKEQWKGGKRRG